MSNLRRLRQQVVGHKRENSEDADDLWACRRRHLLPAISERASTWATATIMPSFDPTALEALLKQYTDPTAPLEARVPGWAFVVRSKDTVLYRKGAGNLEPSTPGWMASVSKLVTPILALKAVESGLITLDTPLQPLIPDVDLSRVLTGFSAEGTPQYESARAPVTLSNAMMHTSG
jgi:CubicO group peptidase (beta-lactamase class C family)